MLCTAPKLTAPPPPQACKHVTCAPCCKAKESLLGINRMNSYRCVDGRQSTKQHAHTQTHTYTQHSTESQSR